MAGGYDGTQEYPNPTDLNSTLRLINDESFVYAGVVSINVVKFQSIKTDLLYLLAAALHIKITLHGGYQ